MPHRYVGADRDFEKPVVGVANTHSTITPCNRGIGALAVRAGLGTLNHTGLSLDALSRRGVLVHAVLLTKIAEAGDPSEQDNAEWLSRRHGVRVLGPVPYVRSSARRQAAYRHALRPLLPGDA